ncbi:recombination protein NinG, partial [Pseudomonas aeruginosa]|uniref:recombination protein NinG n=1 Tax=Pseudomonas aeruginosa TaxID=287 RepID=UPI002F92E347
IKDKHAKRARKAIADRERREIKVRKARLKSRADHLREAQQAFNEFIRLRDAYQPCISCGRHHDGQYHAGHYRTVAASPELRF